MNNYIKKGYNPNSKAPFGNKFGLDNKSNIGRKHTKRTKMLMRKNHKGMKGRKHTEETKAKMRKSHIKFMTSGKMKVKETDIEKKIRKVLIKKDIIFISQFPVEFIAIADFYLPHYKTIIQCDGNFWHKSKWAIKHGKQQADKKQTDLLSTKGYKIFRFTESQIKKSATKCIRKILCES